MPFSLFRHEAGCKPVYPCGNCLRVSEIRERIGADILDMVAKARLSKRYASDETRLDKIGIPTRARTYFLYENIFEVGVLVREDPEQLLRSRSQHGRYGDKTHREVIETLARYGRYFGDHQD